MFQGGCAIIEFIQFSSVRNESLHSFAVMVAECWSSDSTKMLQTGRIQEVDSVGLDICHLHRQNGDFHVPS